MKRMLLVVTACLLGVAACGDDGSEATETTAPTLVPPETVTAGGVLESPTTVVVPDTPLCNAAAEVLAIAGTVEPKVDQALRQGLADNSMQPVFDAVRALSEDGTVERLLAAYDEMTDVVPVEQAENVQTVRAYTKSFLDNIVAMPNVSELQSYVSGAIQSQEGQAATEATAALDQVIQAECRFSISG